MTVSHLIELLDVLAAELLILSNAAGRSVFGSTMRAAFSDGELDESSHRIRVLRLLSLHFVIRLQSWASRLQEEPAGPEGPVLFTSEDDGLIDEIAMWLLPISAKVTQYELCYKVGLRDEFLARECSWCRLIATKFVDSGGYSRVEASFMPLSAKRLAELLDPMDVPARHHAPRPSVLLAPPTGPFLHHYESPGLTLLLVGSSGAMFLLPETTVAPPTLTQWEVNEEFAEIPPGLLSAQNLPDRAVRPNPQRGEKREPKWSSKREKRLAGRARVAALRRRVQRVPYRPVNSGRPRPRGGGRI